MIINPNFSVTHPGDSYFYLGYISNLTATFFSKNLTQYKFSIGLVTADNIWNILSDKNHNSSAVLITIQAEKGGVSRNLKLVNLKGLIEFSFWNN